LLKLTESAVISKCILLDESFPPQSRLGFEGVAEDGDNVVIAIQREWAGEENPCIAVYKHLIQYLEVRLGVGDSSICRLTDTEPC